MADLEEKQRDYVEKSNLEYVKMAHAEWLEGFKGVKEFSTNAIRMLYVLNGGALVALLALLGNMFGKTDNHLPFAQFVRAILPAFMPFAVGLVLAGLVSAFAYINFRSIEMAVPRSEYLLEWLRGQQHQVQPLIRKMPLITARIGFVIAILSLGSFGCGCWQVIQAFQLLTGVPK